MIDVTNPTIFDYQPGTGTRYLILVTPVTKSEDIRKIGYGPDSDKIIVMSFLNLPFKALSVAYGAEQGFVSVGWVAGETMKHMEHVPMPDAIAIAVLAAELTDRPCGGNNSAGSFVLKDIAPYKCETCGLPFVNIDGTKKKCVRCSF